MDTNGNKIYNFSAGPAILPQEVLKKVQIELCNWNNSGKSIIEFSHRSKEFTLILEELEYNLRDLLNIPSYYKVILCHGGARGQFSAVPMNLLGNNSHPDYINSGYWSYNAAIESKKYCIPRIINVKKIFDNIISILPIDDWNINSKSAYLHYCPNETIEGISIHEEPNFGNITVVGDFSSTLLSRVIDIKKYGIIYASSQKNIGPPGTTIIIIHQDLLGKSKNTCPSILDYKILSKNNSMFNTPATFSIYVSHLVLKWIRKLGGLKAIERYNKEKSDLLYKMIDSTSFYVNNIDDRNRSHMNVTFTILNNNLYNVFFKEAHNFGLHCLNGHSVVGGIRASIYNAMPIKGVVALIKFMKIFEKKYK
ncbi:MAG: 3-phosphoserine/phosphohydroxythreonine transaminase [Buchnera aphidicola (Schlechtendalia peitan)]